jgi:hypothetical protein
MTTSLTLTGACEIDGYENIDPNQFYKVRCVLVDTICPLKLVILVAFYRACLRVDLIPLNNNHIQIANSPMRFGPIKIIFVVLYICGNNICEVLSRR